MPVCECVAVSGYTQFVCLLFSFFHFRFSSRTHARSPMYGEVHSYIGFILSVCVYSSSHSRTALTHMCTSVCGVDVLHTGHLCEPFDACIQLYGVAHVCFSLYFYHMLSESRMSCCFYTTLDSILYRRMFRSLCDLS